MEKINVKKLNKALLIVAALLLCIFVATLCPKVMQNDTFWSIKVGEKIVKEGIWEIDDFSVHPNLKYVAHHFLTDVVIYLVYSLGGFLGLYILEIILALIMAGVLYLLNKEISKSKWIAIIFLVLQFLILKNYIAVRAQMISFIVFIIELLLLEKFKKEKKKGYLIGITILPLILANFHMGVLPFYFIILGVYGIGCINLKNNILKTIDKTDIKSFRKLVIAGIIGVGLAFVNPYFIDGVIYCFKTLGNEFINSSIQEFKPYNIAADEGIFLLYIFAILLIVFVAKKKIELPDVLLILGTLFMAFMACRYISLFVICSSVIIRYIKDINKNSKATITDIYAYKVTFIVVLIVLIFIFLPNLEKDYIAKELYPVGATEYLKQNITSEDIIYNEYEWGSYLMLNGIKVFIDSRCDMYTKEYNNTQVADDWKKIYECKKTYKEIIEKYNITTFIIRTESPLATLLNENEDFKLKFSDDVVVIYSSK